mgnify:CR=1 FL=1
MLACHDCHEFREMVAAREKAATAEIERLKAGLWSTVWAERFTSPAAAFIAPEKAEADLAALRERHKKLIDAARQHRDLCTSPRDLYLEHALRAAEPTE